MSGLVLRGISSVSVLYFNVHFFSNTEKIMTRPRKEKKREARSEEKAEKAAVLEKNIEKELLERLRKGVYGDIYDYPVKEYEKILEMDSLQAAIEDEEGVYYMNTLLLLFEKEPEIEYVEGYNELEEELEDDIEDFGGLAMNRVRAIGNNGEDEDGDWDEDDDVEADRKRGRKESSLALRKVEKGDTGSKTKKRAKVLVEVEHENADEKTNCSSLRACSDPFCFVWPAKPDGGGCLGFEIVYHASHGRTENVTTKF